MTRLGSALTALAAAALCATAATASTSGDSALLKYSSAWEKVNTYTCTITAHEASDSHVQDRVFDLYFQKPHDTRLNITGGDGRGSAVIWDGSSQVYGHQGGFLAMFKRHLPLHDRLATSIRGTTVAEANFGALLDHLKGLKTSSIDATADGHFTRIVALVADPAANDNVTKEQMVLEAGGLPVEYDQWQGDSLVRQVKYSEVKLNVVIDPAVFKKL
jgi:outer membrane lipoprotein-sorting protein